MQNKHHPEYARLFSEFNLNVSQAGALLCIALVLLGAIFDAVIYPANFQSFLQARIACSLAVGTIYFILRSGALNHRAGELTFAWLMLPQAMICWMISYTDGAASPYYVGLSLAIYGSGIAIGFGLHLNLGFSIFTCGLYYLACKLNTAAIEQNREFIFNVFQLLFSGAISAVYTYFNERARYMLFKLQKALEKTNGELAQTNKDLVEIKGQMLQQEKMAAIGTLAAGLLHEVNNPVNFCLMAIDVGLEEAAAKSSPMLFECLNDARDGMKRVQYIVSDLKTFAYRKSGAGVENAVFLFEKALDTSIRLTSHEIKGIELTRNLPADTLVRGDEAAIIGVLINLITNAAMAMQKGASTAMSIEISAYWHNDRLYASVRDSGPGIPEENLQRVFEPFFTTREVGQGLGLGLSISYRVIAQHGGELLAESCFGKWTRMLFDLPRAT